MKVHHHLIHVDGLVVDTSTGEVFGYDKKTSVFSERPDYKPELSKCRSADDLEQHLKHVDRRKLPQHTLHSLNDAQDAGLGTWVRSRKQVDCRITIPMMNTLSQLHELVIYRNMIIMSQADLAKSLGTTVSNLMKKFGSLISTNMVRVSTSKQGGIRSDEVKLTINPRLIFRGDDKLRNGYIKHWYRDWAIVHPQSASSMNKNGWNDSTAAVEALAA